MRSPDGLRRTWSTQRKRVRSSAVSGGFDTNEHSTTGREPTLIRACHGPVASSEVGCASMRSPGVRRGGLAGLAAGMAAVAAMYVAALLTGLRPLPDLLQQPILGVMPGPVFGFLIDNLQHAGKVLEEASLIVAMVLGLAVLGALAGYVTDRLGLSRAGLIAAAVAWAL